MALNIVIFMSQTKETEETNKETNNRRREESRLLSVSIKLSVMMMHFNADDSVSLGCHE